SMSDRAGLAAGNTSHVAQRFRRDRLRQGPVKQTGTLLAEEGWVVSSNMPEPLSEGARGAVW
ncbi:hypothetical protein, partial [Piscinibacter sp.]|uniref:hypothetical protein n=1 Tax=Piscinibacter sp. TaxID=1903157 RepID=UPI002F3F5D84